MNFRLLPTLVFASLALNLFLVGVIAGGWRNLLDHTGAPPTAQVPSSEAIPDPPVPATASRPVGPPLPAATPVRAAAQAPDRVPATRPPLPAAPPPPGEGPFPVEAPPREPGGNPLMRAARDLPGPERVKKESEEDEVEGPDVEDLYQLDPEYIATLKEAVKALIKKTLQD